MPADEKEPKQFVREGGTHLNVRNSGLEVWLYDDANRATIREGVESGMGGAPARYDALIREGTLFGYSLEQDDDLEIAIHVGDLLTAHETSVARWLEPQTAFLRLPSGKLCVESNDASRIGPEQPTEEGGVATVPPGDYRVTLYRIDNEAIFREALSWHGPQEVVVLTPGGTAADAATDLLDVQPRRDTSWLGRYAISGQRAEVLVWFADYWDTFVVNLDSIAAAKLSLSPGSYIRTHVPGADLTLVSAFADSWADAQRLPLPAGVSTEEYGFAALQTFHEWNGAQALYCRRATSKTRVEREHHCVWISAVVDVLDARPAEQLGRVLAAADLREKKYFDADFLSMVLSDLLPEVADLDELPLPKALDKLDKRLAKIGLTPLTDVSWNELIRARAVETSARLYAGLGDIFAAILTSNASFEVLFLSELDDATWILTGLADEMERRIKTVGPKGLLMPNPRVQFETMDESLAEIFAAHKKALSKSQAKALPAPTFRGDGVSIFGRFLVAAFD